MSLSSSQRKFLRARAHALRPVVIIGTNGLHEAVLAEIGQALAHHELIKVRFNCGDRDERQAMQETVRDQCRAELVQTIGHIGVFYRRAEKPRITLPRR